MAKAKPKKTAAPKVDNKTEELASALCEVLASTYTLYLKTQNFHWNVVGPWFSQLHPFFGTQYEALAAAIDEIAERIRTIGYVVPASFSHFARMSHIDEAPDTAPRDEEMINLLMDDHMALSKLTNRVIKLSQEAGDEVTADMMIGRATEHDKAAWMLKSHLE